MNTSRTSTLALTLNSSHRHTTQWPQHFCQKKFTYQYAICYWLTYWISYKSIKCQSWLWQLGIKLYKWILVSHASVMLLWQQNVTKFDHISTMMCGWQWQRHNHCTYLYLSEVLYARPTQVGSSLLIGYGNERKDA